MNKESPILEATKRDRLGSRYARRSREQGQLPGVIYGHKIDPVAISLNEIDTLKHIALGEKVFQIKLGDAKPETVLLKELQFGYLGDNIIHADFARVDLTERVHTRVHLNFVGEAKGLKRAGSVFIKSMTEVELDVQVSNIVDHIDVDITDLDVGESLHASDVQLPVSTMKLMTDPDSIIAQITTVAEEEPDEASTAEAAAAPEVLTERKGDDEDKD